MSRAHPSGLPCPACERFIDPVPTCPYCGAEFPSHRLLGPFRWAVALLILAGVLGLLLT